VGKALAVEIMENHLLVHRSPQKRAFYLNSEPVFWSDELHCWITCDPATIEAIQKSLLFRVVDHSGETAKIMSRLRIDLSHIAKVFENVPVNVDGEEHGSRRRKMAKTLSARTGEGLARFERMARTLCAQHLGREGNSDLVSDVFEPLVAELAHALSGIELSRHPEFVSPTQVFDKSLGLNRRKLINEQVGLLRQKASENLPKDEIDTSVALAILGSDTILGSLALSFAERVSSNPSMKMSEIDWGDRLTVTAVPFIERQAARATELGAAHIRQGDIVRLFMDRFTFESWETRDAFFGTGRHACIGRAITQQAWRILATIFGTLPLNVRIDSLSLREADCMFLFPREIKVTIYGG
jgi:cytochrome P450